MSVRMGENEKNKTSFLSGCLSRCRQSRTLVLVIVSIALFLDNMLLTTIVPIIPTFLRKLELEAEVSTTTMDSNVSDCRQLWCGFTGYDEKDTRMSNVSSYKNDTNTGDVMSADITHFTEANSANVTDTNTGDVMSADIVNVTDAHSANVSDTNTGDVMSADIVNVADAHSANVTDTNTGDVMSADITNGTKANNANGTDVNSRSISDVNKTIVVDTLTPSNDGMKVGLMFASKAIVQLICNPFTGIITNRIGYSIPLFTGFVIMMVSTVIFAFGQSYELLFVARAIQGIGSSCSSVSGLGMLASKYPDDSERGAAMGIALGGLALGVLVGPPFGGVLYQFTGKEVPFLILATLALLGGCLQLCVLQPSVKPEGRASSLLLLLKDSHILIAAGSITITNMAIAMIEPTMPSWMYQTMGAPIWQQGMVFLSSSFAYLIGTNIYGPVTYRLGRSSRCQDSTGDAYTYRWISAMLGISLTGICLFCIPLSTQIGHLIAPLLGIGLATGMVDSVIIPHMAYLVDIRHVSVYGAVYAIGGIAYCLGFALGPALSGYIVQAVGFKWLLWIMGIINLGYAPLMICLKNPSPKQEKMSLIEREQTLPQYATLKE